MYVTQDTTVKNRADWQNRNDNKTASVYNLTQCDAMRALGQKPNKQSEYPNAENLRHVPAC